MKKRVGDCFFLSPELGKRPRECRLKAAPAEDVLQGIRTDVFNVGAPIGP